MDKKKYKSESTTRAKGKKDLNALKYKTEHFS